MRNINNINERNEKDTNKNNNLFNRHAQHDESTQLGIDSINVLLDSFMGINDSELAMQVILLLYIYIHVVQVWERAENNLSEGNFSSFLSIIFFFLFSFDFYLHKIWELADNKTNSMDFAEAIDNSDLEAFGFTDDFIIELWGAVTDARRHKRWKHKPSNINLIQYSEKQRENKIEREKMYLFKIIHQFGQSNRIRKALN